jgi:hypothetical protein
MDCVISSSPPKRSPLCPLFVQCIWRPSILNIIVLSPSLSELPHIPAKSSPSFNVKHGRGQLHTFHMCGD